MKALHLLTRLTLAVILIGLAQPLVAQEPAPSADTILKRIRDGLVSAPKRNLSGTIEERRKTKIPFSMNTSGDTIVFRYLINNQWEQFDLKFRDSSLEMRVRQNGKMARIAPAGYAQTIAGTSVTYEDLGMRFIYWRNGKVLPQKEVVSSFNCWVVQLTNPAPNTGNYAWVRLWVSEKDGALMRIDGYDRRGELSKRFNMDSFMKLDDGSWFFKKMKYEVRDPARSTRVQTYGFISVNS